MWTEPLTFSSKTTDFTTQFDNPIKLSNNRRYEAAFFLLETFNTIPNVTNENNNFTYSTDEGKTWKSIKLKKEAYEIEQINNEIQRQMVESGDYDMVNDSMFINISIFASLLSAIEVSNPSYKINFDVENSIGPLLGFDRKYYQLVIIYHQTF
jgi:transcriptional accessory protein Tex/SPT6